ncbi:MAG: DUF1552 domain-containing protein [Myxococcota bacterium]
MISRRTVLRGALGGAAVAVALPRLEAMAGPGGFPKRFGVFFWGNGSLPGSLQTPSNTDRWTPVGTGSGSAWALSSELAPLAPHKDVLCVVTGTASKLPNPYPHGSGASAILSGAPLANEALESFTAATVDQLVAAAIGGDTLYPSLQTAATDTLGLSFSGANARHPCEQSPWLLFDRLFGSTFVEPGSGGLVDPTLALRRSVLDAVMSDLDRLDARVGAADRARLDQHLTGVRELEQRLARLELDPPDLEACARPGEPLESYPDEGDLPQIGERNRVMASLLAMALACDQTRVFSHFLTQPISEVRFAGSDRGYHSLTHDEPDPQPGVDQIVTTCMGYYAEFLSALRAVPEGEGTLLDNTLILGCSEISEGRTHRVDQLPIVLAGSAQGKIRQDFHYRSVAGENVSSVLLTVLRAMDLVVGSFGVDEGEVDQGLSAIEV